MYDDDVDDVCQVTKVKLFAKLLTKLLSLKRQEKSNQVKKNSFVQIVFEFLNAFHRDLSSNGIMALPSGVFSPLKRLGRL